MPGNLRTRTEVTARELDTLIFALMDAGWPPSAIDAELKQPKGYTHDVMVHTWASKDPTFFNRRMTGVKKLDDLGEPEPAPKKPRTRTVPMNSVVAKRYAGRKVNGVKYD